MALESEVLQIHELQTATDPITRSTTFVPIDDGSNTEKISLTNLAPEISELSAATGDIDPDTNYMAIDDGTGMKKTLLSNVASGNNGGYLPITDLGTAYTAELKQDISSGTFKKAVVGGKLTINGHVYYFAHPDYWLHTGDTECTTHHMVVVPAGNLSSGKMNSTNITTGAYIGSDMYTGNNSNTVLADAKAIIEADFGASNILSHKEYFANAVTNGKNSAGAWYASTIDLMNEIMVYGCPIFTPGNDGSTVPANYTVDKTQLKLFAERPDLITTRAAWWLRDVVSGTDFASVVNNGGATYGSASNSLGVRPAFAIC